MAGGSGSGSGSAAGAAVGSSSQAVDAALNPIYVGDKARNSTGDTCGFYKLADDATCRQPRTCYDCLNIAIASESDGCVLSPAGACQVMSTYVASRDYRVNHNDTPLSMAYYNYFPSVNTTYCEAGDPACDRCESIALLDVTTGSASTQITLGQWNGSREIAERFCVGAKGCVCLAACASNKWKNNVQEDCSSGGSSTGVTDAATDNYRSMLPIFMAMQFILILMVIHRQRMISGRFRRAARPADGPYNNPRAISSPSNRLQLTGWRAMQEDLVNREKAQRGLVSLMSPRDNTTIPPQPQPNVETQGQTPAAHNYVIYAPDEDDIPELPPGTPVTPLATRRRASTDASMAILEDERQSEPSVRKPSTVAITEERESRSQ